jgi:aryl-alcohol dehydrogenase-like predicted oxidoreductase
MSMRYKILGKSGLRVSEAALGTMTFGEDWGWGASKEESRKILDAFVEAGGNFIDTAYNYTEGTSEAYVGEFITADRDYFVVATKYTLRPNSANPQDPNAGGNSRKNMMKSVERSLRRLKTEVIDLLYLHMWEGITPIEEVMRGLDDLVRAGKVLYVGFSDTPAYIVSKAVTLAELHGWTRPVAVQVPYSLASRDPEREILPMAMDEDLAVLAWGVLEAGVLTGKFRDPAAVKRFDRASERGMSIADKVGEIARRIGCTPSQVAVNWVRQPRKAPVVIPVLGARRLSQIKENLEAINFELPAECIQDIDAFVDFKSGFPADFLRDDEVIGLVHGKTYPLIDQHRA